MQTYYFVAASKQFMTIEEPLQEVLDERVRNYREHHKAIDFWLVQEPTFLEEPQLATVTRDCPRPAIAVVSTDSMFIRWLKNRLEYVVTGSLQSADIPR
ncbi:MgPME-cyclase complex family protein [Anthocerotibacter panamensis]|uniref:MgPME-cyclase complex family protein n=1 Tax=Anthocerotibacter panamensis TaxID=2857077 RepID=UPI001C4014B2|nr:MgPME-cyclase complex family protein [Anthocerotibacter panamensis]